MKNKIIIDLDYLITFNRVHLKNKEEEINEILSEYGLRTIKITSPEQI